MKLPKRLNNILKKKELFLDEMRAKLENTALRLQGNLFEQIIEEIIPQLDVKNGAILETANNYRLISELDQIYSTFNNQVAKTILPQINRAMETIVKMNEGYFVAVLSTLPTRFDKIIAAAKILIDVKVGLRAEKMIRGGFISSVFRADPAGLLNLKREMSRAVTSQMSMKDFIGVIKDNVK